MRRSQPRWAIPLVLLCFFSGISPAQAPAIAVPETAAAATAFEACHLIGNKLHSVSVAECLALNLSPTGQYTTHGLPILLKEYPPLPPRKPKARILLIGGIHGDEYASFSVVFKWMAVLDKYHSGLFHWRIAPAVNLDGLLAGPATRTNANGVDLNRNMEHDDSDISALEHWQHYAHKNPNRYPGRHALSESESRWLKHEIATFRPDIIISLHAPYGMIDYDGPAHVQPPAQLGSLKLDDLGTPPGSLGYYVHKTTPLLTIELASATSMPEQQEIRRLWVDLVRWLNRVTPVHSP